MGSMYVHMYVCKFKVEGIIQQCKLSLLAPVLKQHKGKNSHDKNVNTNEQLLVGSNSDLVSHHGFWPTTLLVMELALLF